MAGLSQGEPVTLSERVQIGLPHGMAAVKAETVLAGKCGSAEQGKLAHTGPLAK